MILAACGLFLLGYLFGSIPNGLWLVKAAYGMDIRQYGSGNIGATNVFRTVGAVPGLGVLVLDILKGIVPLLLTAWLLHSGRMAAGAELEHLLMVVTACGALLGHNCSLFLHFKGGKGVATGLGLFAYLLPMGALTGFIVWVILVGITRYVSLGSIVGALCAAAMGFIWGYPLPYAIFGVVAALFVILKHKDNIGRLLNGTESKIKAGHQPPPAK
ncbi:MAG: glycerol-3-phosphate 1-O-acyltransferase PlsY [Acidaminococcaceae bacterium]|nr:glycerol-3-phosphate 1-O-acyltransferase PlsY [Acidaminococcaceae bacterium]